MMRDEKGRRDLSYVKRQLEPKSEVGRRQLYGRRTDHKDTGQYVLSKMAGRWTREPRQHMHCFKNKTGLFPSPASSYCVNTNNNIHDPER